MSKLCAKCGRKLSGGERWCCGCHTQLTYSALDVFIIMGHVLGGGFLAFLGLYEGIQSDNWLAMGLTILTWIILMATFMIHLNRMTSRRVIETPDGHQGNEQLQ